MPRSGNSLPAKQDLPQRPEPYLKSCRRLHLRLLERRLREPRREPVQSPHENTRRRSDECSGGCRLRPELSSRYRRAIFPRSYRPRSKQVLQDPRSSSLARVRPLRSYLACTGWESKIRKAFLPSALCAALHVPPVIAAPPLGISTGSRFGSTVIRSG